MPVAGQWTHTHGPTFRTPWSWPTRPCVEYSWHHVCTMSLRVLATRKWRTLKVTPRVAGPGVEFAVYDCLVLVTKQSCVIGKDDRNRTGIIKACSQHMNWVELNSGVNSRIRKRVQDWLSTNCPSFAANSQLKSQVVTLARVTNVCVV